MAAAAFAVLALAGCGGDSAGERARAQFEEYASADGERRDAELELNRAFRALSSAAGERDQAGVVAAVAQGRDAIAAIDRALDTELEAARGLAAYEPTSSDGQTLAEALGKMRGGVRLIERQLEIALLDPFLDADENETEVGRLSTQVTEVSVGAAFDRRRAARAIALALGVEPPFDSMFDN